MIANFLLHTCTDSPVILVLLDVYGLFLVNVIYTPAKRVLYRATARLLTL